MGEKLLEKAKEIWGKIVEWWNHFTSKQKTTIVVIALLVVVAFVVLAAILSSPNYSTLKQCDSTKEASEIVKVLEEENIKYKVSDDGLLIKVPKSSLSSANLSLASKGITTIAYSLDTALAGSFTTTEADKQKKYKLYLEEKFENDFVESFSSINYANVTLFLPDNDGTLLSKEEQAGAEIVLGIDGDFNAENAEFLASAVAKVLNCKNTDSIVILDTDCNCLFTGGDEATASGAASSQLSVKEDAEILSNNKVKQILQAELGDVKVATNLVIDFSTTEKTDHLYTPADGQSQGVLSEESSYTSDSSGGTSGVPGTDSNTETTYQFQDNEYSTSTIEEYYRKYLPNEHIEYQSIPAGVVKYGQSSCAVSSTKYVIVKEDDVKTQGLLDGISWEEYQLANKGRKKIDVPDDIVSLVANATGISEENISVVAYEENVFIDSEGLGIDPYDAIQVALIVIILILLAVVVLKSMRGEKQGEEVEEISVESLLQSNPEPQLDNIELEEVSETRKMIEKFVDENPEAVANLLRNWLNEEWDA